MSVAGRARVTSGDTVPTEDEVRAFVEGNIAPPQPFPDEGSIFPIPTPAGVLLYRVLKANPSRITLVPLSPKETHEVVAFANRQGRELAAWRACLGVSVVAAHTWLGGTRAWRNGDRRPDWTAAAHAIATEHVLPDDPRRSWWSRRRRT